MNEVKDYPPYLDYPKPLASSADECKQEPDMDCKATIKILRRAIEKYGEPLQTVVAIEECAELQKN